MTNIHAKPVLYTLLGIIVILLLLHLGSFWYVISGNMDPSSEIFEKLNFGKEKNVPAIFSSGILFLASILLAVTGTRNASIPIKRTFWFLMSFIFLFLGFDELLRIHEKIQLDVSSPGHTEGIFHYSWVIPYGTALLVLALAILRPLFQLPARTLYGFIFAGGIFVAGAMGMEMFTGWYVVQQNISHENLDLHSTVFLLYTLEETLEMIGTSVFIYFILDFIQTFRIVKPQHS